MMNGACTPWQWACFDALRTYDRLLLQNEEMGISNEHMMDHLEFTNLFLESDCSFDPYVKMEEMQEARLANTRLPDLDFPLVAAAAVSQQALPAAAVSRVSVSGSDYSSAAASLHLSDLHLSDDVDFSVAVALSDDDSPQQVIPAAVSPEFSLRATRAVLPFLSSKAAVWCSLLKRLGRMGPSLA